MKIIIGILGQFALTAVMLSNTAFAANITQNPPREFYIGTLVTFPFGGGSGSAFTTFLNQAGATQGVLDCTLSGGYSATPAFPITLQGGTSVLVQFNFAPPQPGASAVVNCTVDGVPAPQLGLPPGIIAALSTPVAVPVFSPLGILGLAFALIALGVLSVRRH